MTSLPADVAGLSAESIEEAKESAASKRFRHARGKQFIGDFEGAVWNAQAFFAATCSKQRRKRAHVWRLLRNRHFLGITEAHSSVGAQVAVELPKGFTSFWSHGTARRGGVGIIVDEKWLASFHYHFWDVIVPGRVAILHLAGPEGNLDLVVTYFPTGTKSGDPDDPSQLLSLREERARLRNNMAQHLADPAEAVSVVFGDFNTVTRAEDRWNLAKEEHSGARDRSEESHWVEKVAIPKELYELDQRMATFEEAGVRSRIDRVYTNLPPADGLDRHIFCTALEWVPNLSAHRALAFGRRAKNEQQEVMKAIPSWVIKHERFPRTVAENFFKLEADWSKEHGRGTPALLQLKLLKLAIRKAADEINASVSPGVADKEDKVGAILGLLRSVERGRANGIRKWSEKVPEVTGGIRYDNPDSWTEGEKTRLRRLAHLTAKETLVESMQENLKEEEVEDEANAIDDNLDWDDVVQRRSRFRAQVMQKIKKNLPRKGAGGCCGLQ